MHSLSVTRTAPTLCESWDAPLLVVQQRLGVRQYRVSERPQLGRRKLPESFEQEDSFRRTLVQTCESIGHHQPDTPGVSQQVATEVVELGRYPRVHLLQPIFHQAQVRIVTCQDLQQRREQNCRRGGRENIILQALFVPGKGKRKKRTKKQKQVHQNRVRTHLRSWLAHSEPSTRGT